MSTHAREIDPRPKAPMWAKKLDERERRFVEEYLIDWNKTQAAFRAGLATTPGSASSVGHEIYWRQHVIDAIDMAMTMNASTLRQGLVDRLNGITQGDLGQFLEWCDDQRGMVLKKGRDVPPEIRKLLKKVRLKKNGDVELELHDPVRAAEVLSRFKQVGVIGADDGANRGMAALDEIIEASMKIGREQAEAIYARQQAAITGPVIEGECTEVVGSAVQASETVPERKP